MADYYCEFPPPVPLPLERLGLEEIEVPRGGLRKKRIGQSMACGYYG